jgi:hypothetical protein
MRIKSQSIKIEKVRMFQSFESANKSKQLFIVLLMQVFIVFADKCTKSLALVPSFLGRFSNTTRKVICNSFLTLI